jgi:hypothetical protein
LNSYVWIVEELVEELKVARVIKVNWKEKERWWQLWVLSGIERSGVFVVLISLVLRLKKGEIWEWSGRG